MLRRLRAVDEYDFAILVLTPDDETTTRGHTVWTPRDNAVLEFGLFVARLGLSRTFIVSHPNVKLPTDVAGITIAGYETRRDRNQKETILVGTACTDIIVAIEKEGRRNSALLGPAWFHNAYFARLNVSRHAKQTIAEYCVNSDFWRPGDSVFIEAGTLPLYMVLELFKKRPKHQRPKVFVTNNLACPFAEQRTVPEYDGPRIVSDTCIRPLDRVGSFVVLPGLFMEDYAATVPDELVPEEERSVHMDADDYIWSVSAFVECLENANVNHFVMMVSTIRAVSGPGNASITYCRFKKLLLRFLWDHPDVRCSLLFEADKLIDSTNRRGMSADAQHLPDARGKKYWQRLLKARRVRIITALSPELSDMQIDDVKSELGRLKDLGADCTLLDLKGDVKPM